MAGDYKDYEQGAVRFHSVRKEFFDPVLMSVDSPMVVYTVHHLGPGSAVPPHGTEGTVFPDPGSGGGTAPATGTPVTPAQRVYWAVCDAAHSADLPGASGEGGSWSGTASLRREDACFDAQQHQDGQAFVVTQVGDDLAIGPVACS